MLKTLLSAMISFSSIGFTREATEDWNEQLREAIEANENKVVDHYDEDKIYLNPDKIHPTPQGIYLNLNDQEFIFVPALSSDARGCYVQVSDASWRSISNDYGNSYKMLLTRSHRDRNDDRGGASLEGGVTGKWGDGNGIQWEGYAKAEAHDRKGNYAEAEVVQKDDGTGRVDVRGGHEREKK